MQLEIQRTRPDEMPMKAAIKFFHNPVQNKDKTSKEGRPIFDNVEFVEIAYPGKTDVVVRKVREEDKQLYAAHYAQFKNEEEQIGQGTPLALFPLLTPAEVQEARYFKCYTIEHLAELKDGPLSVYAKKAQEYLKATKNAAKYTQLEAENAKMKTEIESLKAHVDELKSVVNKLSASKKKEA